MPLMTIIFCTAGTWTDELTVLSSMSGHQRRPTAEIGVLRQQRPRVREHLLERGDVTGERGHDREVPIQEPEGPAIAIAQEVTRRQATCMKDSALTTPNPSTAPVGGTCASPVGCSGGPAGPVIRRLPFADTTVHACCSGSNRAVTSSPSVVGSVSAAALTASMLPSEAAEQILSNHRRTAPGDA
jgi:hypothetical protein